MSSGLSNGPNGPNGTAINTDGGKESAESDPLESLLSTNAPGAGAQILDRKRLQELVKEVDVNEVLDEEVEDMLLRIADDFLEQTITAACQMARHRKVNTIEVKDVQLVLERNWNMWIPGFGSPSEELRHHKRSALNEAHKSRMALIRKTLKKY